MKPVIVMENEANNNSETFIRMTPLSGQQKDVNARGVKGCVEALKRTLRNIDEATKKVKKFLPIDAGESEFRKKAK